MSQICINIACGNSYLEGWQNFDYAPHSKAVRKANLLDRLPVLDSAADVVYSSHFLEHIPCNHIVFFLSECFRISKSRGQLRLVLPDWEELCRTYLACRGGGEHDRANFLILEMIDQCVRSVPGGELGAYYARLEAAPELHESRIKYVRQQTGHLIPSAPASVIRRSWLSKLTNPLNIFVNWESLYCRWVLALLPKAFRQQNVSLATVGERHAWMYDFYTVEHLLRQVGFIDVQRMTATTSNIVNFPFCPLDVTVDGMSRKGAESMYIEAVRP